MILLNLDSIHMVLCTGGLTGTAIIFAGGGGRVGWSHSPPGRGETALHGGAETAARLEATQRALPPAAHSKTKR